MSAARNATLREAYGLVYAATANGTAASGAYSLYVNSSAAISLALAEAEANGYSVVDIY